MNFVEFCITKGYKAYRKVFNLKTKKWEYVEATNTTFFSSIVNGCMDIRLIKEGHKEIVYGIPCIFSPKDEFTGEIKTNVKKTHFPTLIYPNPFGNIYEVDRAFEKLSFEEILNEIERG